MKSKSIRICAYILGILPLIALIILYNKLPEMVPTHWDIDGSVDYSEKVTLWMTASIPIILAVLFDVIPKMDPRRANYEKFSKYYDYFCLVLILMVDILNAVTFSESLAPGRLSVSKIICLMLGGLFAFIGNILPKIKNNFTMGIKTPWTLSDPDVWNKTHRLGGKLFFIFGVAIFAGGLFLSEKATFVIMIAGILIITIVPAVMSYIWYSRINRQ